MPKQYPKEFRDDVIKVVSLLQKNVLDRKAWASREELRTAIVRWIERTYHRRRRQDRLGRLTPVEFEAMMYEQVALAA